MESLGLRLVRITLSKNSWKIKTKYFFLSTIFYVFLLIEENKIKNKGSVDAEASAAGDDVYPLF